MLLFLEKNKFWLRCTACVWGVLTLVFSFYMVTFYFGNHDYRFMRYGVLLSSGVWEGRFTQFVLPHFLFEGQVLPVLNVLTGFLFYVAAAVLLAKWYNLVQCYLTVVLFALVIVLNPYIISQLYYVHSIVSILSYPLFCVGGLMLIDAGATKRKRWFSAVGAGGIFFSFCGYAGTIELVLTLLTGKILVDVMLSAEGVCSLIKRYMGIVVISLAMVVIYAILLTYLKSRGIVDEGMYNVQTLTMAEVYARLGERWIEPWRAILMPSPYCSQMMKWCLLGLMTLMFIAVGFHKRLWLMSLGFIGLIYVMYLLAFISPFNFFRVFRIQFFAVPYLVGIVYALVLRSRQIVLRNLAFVFVVVLLCCYVKADFFAQKVWVLGYRQDEAAAERMRKDFLPRLPKDKHYRAAIVGGFYGNEKFANERWLTGVKRETYREAYGFPLYLNVLFSGGFFLFEPINPIWGDALFSNGSTFYIFNNDITNRGDLYAQVFMQSFGDDKFEQIEAVKRLKPWPHPDYFFIGKKDIFLMLGDGASDKRILLDMVRK